MPRTLQDIVEQHVAEWHAENLPRRKLAGDSKTLPNAVVISYAPQSRGESIAHLAANQLGLPHYDHEILERIAQRAQVHVESVESVDEHVQGRVEETVASLMREGMFDRDLYLKLLKRTVVTLWRNGPCVLSGHGAFHIVPRDHALTVRLFAPRDVRAAWLAKQRGIDQRAAAKELEQADAEQWAFHRRLFRASIDDVEQHDLIIDTARLPDSAVAMLIRRAFRERFGLHPRNRRRSHA